MTNSCECVPCSEINRHVNHLKSMYYQLVERMSLYESVEPFEIEHSRQVFFKISNDIVKLNSRRAQIHALVN